MEDEDFGHFNDYNHADKRDDDWNHFTRSGNTGKKFVSGGVLHSTSTHNKAEHIPKILSSRSDIIESGATARASVENVSQEAKSTAGTNISLNSRIKSTHLEFMDKNLIPRAIVLSASDLSNGPITFGRESKNARLDHISCSRRHAHIFCEKSPNNSTDITYFLEDLGSANGTLLNGGKLPPFSRSKLEDGDELQFGFLETVFTFHEAIDSSIECRSESDFEENNKESFSNLSITSKLIPDLGEVKKHVLDDLVSKDAKKNKIKETHTKHSGKDASQILKHNSDSIRCSHILLKHSESRNPYDSYRKKIVKRTKQEACSKLKEIERVLNKDLSQFKDYASEFSECSSCQNQGDLFFFKKGSMQHEFELAAFNLKVGELSSIVETKSGLHLILRTA